MKYKYPISVDITRDPPESLINTMGNGLPFFKASRLSPELPLS